MNRKQYFVGNECGVPAYGMMYPPHGQIALRGDDLIATVGTGLYQTKSIKTSYKRRLDHAEKNARSSALPDVRDVLREAPL